jgi:hypothetical protein
MRHHPKDWSGATLVAAAIIVALALVASPELRALLLFSSSLGPDLLALLLATQLRHFVSVLLPAANALNSTLCTLAFSIASCALWAYSKALPWRPFDKLFCPALVFVTYGVRCRIVGALTDDD